MDGADARVAVVIPAFNAAGFIGEALESIHEQDHPSIRIIVVDDGSTDDTSERVRDWASSSGSELLLLRQPNAGISVARNLGILHSDEPILAFLDADDRYYPGHIRRLVAALAICPEALLAFDDVTQFTSDGEIPDSLLERAGPALSAIASVAVEGCDGQVLGDGLFTSLLSGNWIAPSSWVVPRTTFARCGLFDPDQHIVEDREFLLRAARHGSFLMVPEIGVGKRVHETNVTRAANAELFSKYSLRALATTRARSEARHEAAIDRAIADAIRDLWYQASLRGQRHLAMTAGWVRQLGLTQRPSARDVARAAMSAL